MAYRFDSYDQSLVIDGWEKGVADTPYAGISDIRNCNITSIPGEASVNFSTVSITLGTSSGTVVSMDSSNNQITVSGVSGALQIGQKVRFSGLGGGSGVSNAMNYWVRSVVSSTIFTISANPATNPVVTITGTDSGTFASGGTMGKPVNKTYYNNAGTVRYFIIDNLGQVFELNQTLGVAVNMGNNTDPDSNGDAHGNGLIAYQGFLFIFRNHKIDYIKLSDNSFTASWQTLITAVGTINQHPSLQSFNDSKIYFGDSNSISVFYVNQGSTFNPSDGGVSYTYTQSVMQIPTNDIVQSLAELGSNLLIGGQLNSVYPWDRIIHVQGSAGNLSVLSFYSTPILVAENFISRMITVNTNTYIFAGVRGRIYVTNGSQASFFKKVPDHISGTVEPYFQWGDVTSIKNQLFFGVTCTTNAKVAINQYGGVWGIDLDTTALRLAQKLSYAPLSTDPYAGIASVLLPIITTDPTLPPSGTGMYIGWDSGTSTYGVDQTSSTPYTGSQTTIDSDLIPIGTFNKPRDFTNIEYRLARPLVSGESITIKTRLVFNTTDVGYTTTLTDSTAGNYSGTGKINFKKAQWVQFQIVLNSTASSPSYVRMKEIRLMGLVGPTMQSSQSLSL